MATPCRLETDGDHCYSAPMEFVTPDILYRDVQEAQRRITYWIMKLAADQGLSRSALIRYSGLSSQGVTYLTQGQREPGLRTICALARALGVDVEDLLKPLPDGAVVNGDWS
jgi:transcriptional regulator with XRE-family HTH domain